MRILTINAGSSTVRLNLHDLSAGTFRLFKSSSCKNCRGKELETLREFLNKIETTGISAVAHRFVHGGGRFSKACVISKEVRETLQLLSPLAPLHNPVALSWFDAAKQVMAEGATQIAVFDTKLYAELPEVARIYAIPRELSHKYGLRRYGFHGLAHSAMYRRLSELSAADEPQKVITLQLGSGCSVTAFLNGRAVDTSMGFSPMEGLVMATRPGDLDPGLLLYLQKEAGLSVDELEQMLNYNSGLKGLSGTSGDMRELLVADDAESKLAIDIYCYRIRKYLGAFISVLGGVDTIVFGGGVGENAPTIRENILNKFDWLGLELDFNKNADAVGQEQCVSTEKSRVMVWVLPVDEASEMLEQARVHLSEFEGELV